MKPGRKNFNYVVALITITLINLLIIFADLGAGDSTHQPVMQTPKLNETSLTIDEDALIKEKPCNACDGMNMTESDICKGGGPYRMNETNGNSLYLEIMNSIIEPPKAKKRFNESTKFTKLEVAYIEMHPNLDSSYKTSLYNIAHIYGGTDVALTLVCHADAYSQVMEMLDDGWTNIRVINGSQAGQPFGIPDYNRMLTDPKFWSNFDSRFVLITHIDAAIFRKLDDWMYDFVMIGSPWGDWIKGGKPKVGNGGYTLRHVHSMKAILQSVNYREKHPDAKYPEDVWWHDQIQILPNEQQALEFSFENKYIDNFIPTGSHKQQIKAPHRMAKALWHLQRHYARCI